MKYSFKEIENLLKESSEPYESNEPLKFLVDAQLPQKLSVFLNSRGFTAIHTLDLPDKNATTDQFIREKTYNENLILITKDDDFLRSFLIEKKPARLILVKTGNVSNKILMDIFDKGLETIILLMRYHLMIEITNEEIIAHD
jgi:predicted nuclease of predicted toxin-antitoxin system